MEIEILQSEMGACHKCESIFARLYVDPITLSQPLNIKPVFAGIVDAPVMLIGKAPGIIEYESGRAFQGQAGGGIRKIFSEVGIRGASFDKLVYQTSITKCFP